MNEGKLFGVHPYRGPSMTPLIHEQESARKACSVRHGLVKFFRPEGLRPSVLGDPSAFREFRTLNPEP